MSKRYPGGLITKTPVTPTPSAAPGIWTLEQQLQAQQAGTWPFGGPFNYIEDVFSTYLYTGTGAAQTITNGINLSTNGGLVWMKGRSGATDHALYDTARGATFDLISNSAAAQTTQSTGLTSFGSTGFSIGALAKLNTNAATYVSWTFRKQPKFFDVVTYTGTGSATTIAHNLGSAPGCVIVKCTNAVQDWVVYHNGLTSAGYGVFLNATNAQTFSTSFWNSTAPTSSVFTVGNNTAVNGAGNTYVAYLFAHNAGGFGLTGTDNVITCGSFTTDSGGNATVTLGYEPAWLMFKCSSNAGQNWEIIDTMRGWSMSTDVSLQANSAVAEASGGFGNPTATGFVMGGQGNTQTYIYIAIRRGPMKVPTVGTSVYGATVRQTNGVTTSINTGLTVTDLMISGDRSGVFLENANWFDRLRGPNLLVKSTSANPENNPADVFTSWAYQQGYVIGPDPSGYGVNYKVFSTTYPVVYWNFQRAPGFFDEVCYTGTGVATTQTHNLGVVPELMIFKQRSGGQAWPVYTAAVGPSNAVILNTNAAAASNGNFNNTTPTASVFNIGQFAQTNEIANTYVAYLFATCPGVSKVGSYSGTGATQTIDCGFTGGARFVLIKRTDSTGDWYVWDTGRGMVAGTDPSLLLNSNAAEVNANSVYTTGVGFQIVSTAAGINASGGTYIFLAVA